MILIIDNYDSFTYNLYQMVAVQNPSVEVIRHDEITVADIKQKKPSAILLSPGPGHPEESGICIPVIHTFSGKIPILGVCLGHQAIVLAFGGHIVRAKHIVHGKSSFIYHSGDGIFKDLPQPFSVGRYHSLIADKNHLPDTLTIEAQTEEGEIMAVKHRTHLTIGVQFHPESILTLNGDKLIHQFLQLAAEYK